MLLLHQLPELWKKDDYSCHIEEVIYAQSTWLGLVS
jgi:hypothetical protein